MLKFQHLIWGMLVSPSLTLLSYCSWPSLKPAVLFSWGCTVSDAHSISDCMETCVSTLQLFHSLVCCHVTVCRSIKGPANETSCLHHCQQHDAVVWKTKLISQCHCFDLVICCPTKNSSALVANWLIVSLKETPIHFWLIRGTFPRWASCITQLYF